MAHCPMCDCEFDDGTTECPDCGVPLAEKAEESTPEIVGEDLPTDGLVVVESTRDRSRAREIRELLEEGGIPCFLSNEHFATNLPKICAILETKILIPREMKRDADKLIRDYSKWRDDAQTATHHDRGAASHRRLRP